MQLTTPPTTVEDNAAARRSFSAPGRTAEEIQRARSVLQLVGQLVGWNSAYEASGRLTPKRAEAALDAAQDTVVFRLADPGLRGDTRTRISGLLPLIAHARAAIREADEFERRAALSSASGVLDRLRSATTVERLIQRAPSEVARVGYERCVLSRLSDGYWVARSAFVDGDPDLALAIIAAGNRQPRRVDQNLVESDLLRRRAPILVVDAQTNPRVHPEFAQVTGSRSYIAAPLVVGRSVVGFVHADAGQTGIVDEFNRDMLGMVAECLGYAFERAVYHERLQAIKRQVGKYGAAVMDMVDEMVEADLDPASTPVATEQQLRAAPPQFQPASTRSPALTPREHDVLELMAAGDTNSRVASTLFITEATVKTHVKHILRKLDASNRAEAVSRYLRR
jgi:DNA-binding CsgD family transcriptional regulator